MPLAGRRGRCRGDHPRRFERLADDLLKRGHGSARVEKILGNNFARLFGEVWG
ncbi:hypothetical protein [Sphingomonas sp.]|uniref:hypothetical protein n=1 Tax=Sphingomonas sp. TaxID=28214 RepID=UPI00286EAE48|nr:hypothetical protein [Sphingomonas sp.]